MDDSVITETTVSAATTSTTTSGATSMSVTEVTGLVQLFNNSLLAMEGRLSAKMDDSTRLASERWVKHDHDSERTIKDIADRFKDIADRFKAIEDLIAARTCTVEEALVAHIKIAEEYWRKEREQELVRTERVKPVFGAIAYVRSNWKTILLVIVSLLSVLGFSQATLHGISKALGLG